MSTVQEKIELMLAKKEHLMQGGGEKSIAKQHSKGKLTARERLNLLFDEDTFVELDMFVRHRCTNFGQEKKELPGEGVVTGYGTIDGRLVYAFAQDFTVEGGSLGEKHAHKIWKVMDLAMKMGAPCIGINDSGGARIQEAVDALSGYGGIQMFITGPAVIKSVTAEEVTAEELGGAMTHNSRSGVAHFAAENDEDCIEQIRYLLSFLPSNNMEETPRVETGDDPNRQDERLNTVVPDNPNAPYDMKDVIRSLVDNGEFYEVHQHFATNIICCFARFDGRAVGIIANEPNVMAGCLDVDASNKSLRFIRFCDAFNIPLVNLVDVPGFLPGVDQEYSGIIRHGAKMLYAYSEATVPKITVITRKAYGGSYIAMCNRELGADQVMAWPTSEIAVMGPAGAANIIFRKDPDKDARTAEYIEEFATPYKAAERGYIDMVITPSETRPYIITALNALSSKREDNPAKKHGNIPL